METPPGFDPYATNFGIKHEIVGPLVFVPVRDLSGGNPAGYDINHVVKGKGGHMFVPLESDETLRINADLCGERNGRANGEVIGNRIICDKCAPMFCLFRKIIISRMATVLEDQKKMKKLEVTT